MSDLILIKGVRVKSVAIGKRNAFFGTIVGTAVGGWIVSDEKGKQWIRTSIELTPITEVEFANAFSREVT